MANRIEQLETILKAEPNDAFCLYGLAQEHAKLGRHEEAVSFYKRTIAVDPDSFYSFFHMARSLEELGRSAEAVTALKEGLQRARSRGDGKAAGELAAYLDELS